MTTDNVAALRTCRIVNDQPSATEDSRKLMRESQKTAANIQNIHFENCQPAPIHFSRSVPAIGMTMSSVRPSVCDAVERG